MFKWTDDRFVDITALARQRPDLLQAHSATTNYHLELSATEVRAGLDSYTLRVPELPNTAAVILYALDGKVMEPFRVDLDSRGETRFDVPKETKGTYTFVAIRQENESAWVPVIRSIQIR